MMFNPITLEATAATTEGSNGMSVAVMIGVYVVFFGLLYLIFFRPQQKKKKKLSKMYYKII